MPPKNWLQQITEAEANRSKSAAAKTSKSTAVQAYIASQEFIDAQAENCHKVFLKQLSKNNLRKYSIQILSHYGRSPNSHRIPATTQKRIAEKITAKLRPNWTARVRIRTWGFRRGAWIDITRT